MGQVKGRIRLFALTNVMRLRVLRFALLIYFDHSVKRSADGYTVIAMLRKASMLAIRCIELLEWIGVADIGF